MFFKSVGAIFSTRTSNSTANLPFDISPKCKRRWDRLAVRWRGDVDSIAIDVAIAMHDVPEDEFRSNQFDARSETS